MGATKQILKTRTTTKTAITQKQSLDLVQTLLHGSLSTLSYLRNFFPEKVFDQQIYSADDGILAYEKYAAGESGSGTATATKDQLTSLRVLRRQRSRRVDTFLDWLEKAAFAALKDGTLRAVQIAVHADQERRENAVELYTFTITYHATLESGQAAASIELGSPTDRLVTVETTNDGFQKLLRSIMQLCDELPDLPKKRYISMKLSYLSVDATNFLSQGFTPSTTDKFLFPRVQGWEENTEQLRNLPSAHHTTKLEIKHLQPILPSQFRGVDTLVPLRLDCSAHSVDSTQNIANASYPDAGYGSKYVEDERPNLSTSPQTQSLRRRDDKLSGRLDVAGAAHVAGASQQHQDMAQRVLSVPLPNSLDTQSANVPNMKTALQTMLRPEVLTQGDTQVQYVEQELQISTKMVLRPEIAAALRREKVVPVNSSRTKRSGSNKDVVLCQCGHNEEELHMINCSFCDTWQHVHCYGFSHAQDPRVPDEHACYRCLLAAEHGTLLQEMREMTLKRRAMTYVLRNAVKTKSDMVKVLGISPANVDGILQYLFEETFITSASLSRKPRSASNRQNSFLPTKAGLAYIKMQQDLFNPLRHVEHFYVKPPATAMKEGHRSLAQNSGSMLPPTTPHAGPQNQPTPTTVSATPSGFHSHIASSHQSPLRTASTLKRGSPDNDVFQTPSKRVARSTPVFKRLQSVQTGCILRADGLSSSPVR